MSIVSFAKSHGVTARRTSYGICVEWPEYQPPPRLQLGNGPVLESHEAHSLPGTFVGSVLDIDARKWFIFCAMPVTNDNN